MSLLFNMDERTKRALSLLLAEDDPALRDTLFEALSMEGFEVYPAGTGGEAIDIALRQRVAFSIMDIDLSGMNGIDVFKRIIEERGHMPCIFMSGDASEEVMERALDVGAFTFLSKPIKMDLMRYSVDRLVRKFFHEGKA